MAINAEEFNEIVKSFQEIGPQEADKLLEDKSHKTIFVGRPTCPYCRKFAPKLANVAQENDLKVYYVNSEHPDYTEELKVFRDKYSVATVPGLLFSNETENKVRTDSSMTEEEIKEFVELSK